jgi:hypothetical protein
MKMILDLWLAILLAAVFVFIVSSILHMCVPIHKSDFQGLPNEEAVLESMRAANVEPGAYMFPHCESMQDLAKPEMVEKYNQGPVGHMVVLPNGPFAMGKSLLHWFAFCIVVSLMTGYATSIGLGKGADGMLVFRSTFVISFLTYGVSAATNSIWKGVTWIVTCKFFFDGLMYALATAGTFAWLWPEK